MEAAELFDHLARLRQAKVGGVRAPYKPLLLLWLFGRFATTGSSAVTYAEADLPLRDLVNQYSPAVSPAQQRVRAAMPFVHLERELWELRGSDGQPIAPSEPEQPGRLTARGAQGRLRAEVERLIADPAVLARAARLLIDLNFTPLLGEHILADVGPDLPLLEAAGVPGTAAPYRRRQSGFAETVLRAYAYTCAMCGYDGALGRIPVGLEAAHVRWFSQNGPDAVSNALALCALHHTLLDLGVLA